jgi:hypothetical protein
VREHEEARGRERKIEGKRTGKKKKKKRKVLTCVRGIRQSSVVALIKKHWTEVCCGEGGKE